MMTNPTGRLTQGQFSFLPDLTDEEIRAQIQYGLDRGYAWSVEYTDDPHPRNTYWEMHGLPMFDLQDAAGVMAELQQCRAAFPGHYIRMMAFSSVRGVESITSAARDKIDGICSPRITKIRPLAVNCTASHTAVRRMRVEASA